MAECLAWPRRHSDACFLQGYRYGRKFSSAKCATVCVLQLPTSNAVLFTDPVGMRPSQVPRKWRLGKMTPGASGPTDEVHKRRLSTVNGKNLFAGPMMPGAVNGGGKSGAGRIRPNARLGSGDHCGTFHRRTDPLHLRTPASHRRAPPPV